MHILISTGRYANGNPTVPYASGMCCGQYTEIGPSFPVPLAGKCTALWRGYGKFMSIHGQVLRSNVDMTQGRPLNVIFSFALPLLMGNLFNQLYNVVDTAIVGRALGADALAAVGSSYTLMTFLTSILLGLCMGSGAAISMQYGSGEQDRMRQSVFLSFVLIAGISLVLNVLVYLGLDGILWVLRVPEELRPLMKEYLLIIFLGITATFLYNYFANLLRAIGNSVMPLVFLLISSGLNVVLDLLFIARMGMGVQGAAVATVISQGVSVVLCILYIFLRVKILLPEKQHFRVGSHLYWELFSQSISMGLMSSIVSAGSVVLQYGINGLGTLVIAGHTAARKLFSFTTMPVMAMASACSTFVSQNCGANQPERVRKGMKEIALYSVVVAVLAIFLMQLGAEWMVRLISGSSESVVLENGARYLLWNAPFYSVLGVLLATRYALQSLGQKVLPLFSSVIELVGKVVFVLFFIPKFAYNAVILCEPIIWCFMAAYLVAVYRRDAFVYPRKKTI